MRGYDKNKQEMLKRLRRIEGQVRGLQRMVEEDSYCIDVLTQITAANSALKSVAVGLLEDHIGNCVARGSKAKGSEGDELVAEASAAIARLVRS
jgi:CsoR family transcriptional regulator, copper-sensing transcriptional repressor